MPHSSWHWGFAAAAVGMFCGLVQYTLGGKHLPPEGLRPVRPTEPAEAAKVAELEAALQRERAQAQAAAEQAARQLEEARAEASRLTECRMSMAG